MTGETRACSPADADRAPGPAPMASGDGGDSWGPIVHLEPRFPLGGGYSAPLIVAGLVGIRAQGPG